MKIGPTKSKTSRSVAQCSFFVAVLIAAARGRAAAIAPDGCPIFHCTVEATGLVVQPLISSVLTTISSSSLGQLSKQGCSGDGTVLSCIFSSDSATGIAAGTLKVLDATTLQPIWGSAGAPDSFNLNPNSSAGGQVPVNFADGSIAAGDAKYEVHYSSSGSVLGKAQLTGTKQNFGLTPISTTYGIVSQQGGQLTLINLATWRSVQTLVLTDPLSNGPVTLVSPSSGSSNVLYAVAQDTANNNGFLYSVALNPRTNRISVSSVFAFTGQTGASPVVVTPAVTGLSSNLVLLHVPGLPGDAVPQNRLLGLLDQPGVGLTQDWSVSLPQALDVAPTVDPASRTLFYHHNMSPALFQSDLITGAPIRSFNLQTIGKFPSRFELNSHLSASSVGSVFTLLLGGEDTPDTGPGAQYVMTFQPLVSPRALMWSSQIASVPAKYLAGWNFAPSSQPGTSCPVALTVTPSTSAIVRLCDF